MKKYNYEMLDKSISFGIKTWAINLSVVLTFRNHFNSFWLRIDERRNNTAIDSEAWI